jgi:hypothetical protein
MNRTSKLLVVALAVAAATVTGLNAGSTSQGEESTPASSDPTTFSFTVERGKPSGNYSAGTQVTVTADAAPSGAQFAGGMGDVAILANPSLPTTSATIPSMGITITATYTASAAKSLTALSPMWEG